MEEELSSVRNQAIARIEEARSLKEVEEIRASLLGKKGALTLLFKDIVSVPITLRKQFGLQINETKKTLEASLSEKSRQLKEPDANSTDLTIPPERIPYGHLHLITQAIDEIHQIFKQLGFVRVRYPEVEWDWFAYGALGFSENHPARSEWETETFVVDAPSDPKYGAMILTPHTSSGQVREMKRVQNPPIRMINIGKTYRRESDASHIPMFHQFEGLVVDEGISIPHLRGTLDYFAKQFYGSKRKTRIRPHNFPFTEPSFEVDINCGACDGSGCSVCKEGWLELGGAGMVHPVVLKNGGIDHKKYNGFAFGWGVERVLMVRAGLTDVRQIYGTDLRFLTQF